MINEVTQMQLNASNEQAGKLRGYDCNLCHNKGLIYKLDAENNICAQKCVCMKIRKLYHNGNLSGLSTYLNKSIQDFQVTEEWQEHLYNSAIDFMNDEDDGWFMITGQSGAGKTLLCSIIANHLLFKQDKNVTCLMWPNVINEVKRGLMSDNVKEANDTIERMKNAEILFIDDLLKPYNKTDVKYAIEIINHRYFHRLKTIITSELSIGDLYNIDEALASRLLEMTGKHFYKHIAMDANKNYRIKNANFDF